MYRGSKKFQSNFLCARAADWWNLLKPTEATKMRDNDINDLIQRKVPLLAWFVAIFFLFKMIFRVLDTYFKTSCGLPYCLYFTAKVDIDRHLWVVRSKARCIFDLPVLLMRYTHF